MSKQTNREKALNALLSAKSITEAAAACELSEKTLYRYLKDADFKKEYRAARRDVYEQSVAQMQSAASQAVEALIKNLTCGNPNAVNAAARIILENCAKGIETLDILERLEALEAANEKQ